MSYVWQRKSTLHICHFPGTSYMWQREVTQHILHGSGDVICMVARRHTARTSFYREVICVTARRHTTHTSLSRWRYMYGSEKARNTYFIIQGTSYVWQREGTQHVRHYPGDVICIAAKRHTTRTSLSRGRHMYDRRRYTTHTSFSRGRHMYGSEKVHNTYVIVHGTSYV